MRIKTNTPALIKHRRMILELLLAAHCRDCTTCDKSGACRLQELALRYGVKRVRFADHREEKPLDTSSKSIVRDPNKHCPQFTHWVSAIFLLNAGITIASVPRYEHPFSEYKRAV